MIRYEEALTGCLGKAAARRHDLCARQSLLSLERAVGRVLAEEIVTRLPVPAFANSAMDGFALRAADTLRASIEEPARLSIAGTVVAGDLPPSSAAGEIAAWEIMTGAPVPEGCDAVVKVEETRVEKGLLLVTRPLSVGENVRPAGEDFARDATVIPAGTHLGPEHVLAAAGLGISQVKVHAQPKVCVLSTGAELVPHHSGRPLRPGQIYNSTTPFLLSSLWRLGAKAESFGIVRDEPREFLAAFDAILAEEPDVILTTGAVSMGKHDFLAAALSDRQARVAFHKVAIRPGKPLLVAELPGAHVGPVLFGLPGNPISTVVGFRFFVEPYLRALTGRVPEAPWRVELAEATKKPEGLRCFFKARWDRERGTVRALPGQSSALVRPLLEANAWVVLPEEGSLVPAGTRVEVWPLEGDRHE
jgi:molybdopterin molybdotransferase